MSSPSSRSDGAVFQALTFPFHLQTLHDHLGRLGSQPAVSVDYVDMVLNANTAGAQSREGEDMVADPRKCLVHTGHENHPVFLAYAKRTHFIKAILVICVCWGVMLGLAQIHVWFKRMPTFQ